jgi:hypothetical protein
MSALTASTALALNASKQAVSVTNTGTGNNVLSASPTLTGTVDAAAVTLSSTLTLNGGTANGVLYLNGSKAATSGSALVFDGTNLGIGTSSPKAKLQSTGAAATTTPTGGSATGSAQYLTNTNDAFGMLFGISGGGAGWIQQQRTDATNTQYDLLLNPIGGNVGIGTSSPVAKLSVQDASVPKFALQVGSAERAFLSYTESNFTTRLDSDGPLVFAANNAEAGRFDISGNLGIGTSSPGHRLDVVGDAKIRPSSGYNALFEVSGSALRINYLNDALSANVSAAFRAADFVFQTAGATERARITADGNIVAGGSSALATTATNGFLYVPTCAGTPTGTPTAITGMAPIVVNTTNNKLYFYSGGAWRDAGP